MSYFDMVPPMVPLPASAWPVAVLAPTQFFHVAIPDKTVSTSLVEFRCYTNMICDEDFDTFSDDDSTYEK